jgi:hypothetical protein
MKIKAMPIQDWNDCELVLGEVREIELKADARRTRADKAAQKIKEELTADLAEIEAGRAKMEQAIEAFVRDHAAELAPLKSKLLRFGTVGLRSLPKFSWPKNDTLIARLKELDLGGYIRTVPAHDEPNKKDLEAHWEKLPLKDLGAKRKVQETFYIDLVKEQ